MTSPAGPAAGVHLPWARVPERVRAWATEVGGGSPTSIRDVSGGFSPGATSVLDCPGRSIFVKAVGAELNPDSPAFHRREVRVSAALSAVPCAPRLLSTYDDADWVALAFEVVDGRPPLHPWDSTELEAVVQSLAQLHRECTPCPVPGLDSLVTRAASLFGGWAELAGSDPPAAIDEWAVVNLSRLADLESGWPAACGGDTLLHGDLRADNVLIGPHGVVFVDWPHASVGNPAFDIVAWAPSVVLEGGPAPDELLAAYDPSETLNPEDVTVLLAAIAGFFVAHSLHPAPPGLPTLRSFQQAQGDVALTWLRRRTGW